MVMTPNTNVITVKDITIHACLASAIAARTKSQQIPPTGNLLVNRHETGVDVRLIPERAMTLNPDRLAVVQKGVQDESGN
jgi:hypothetical protein